MTFYIKIYPYFRNGIFVEMKKIYFIIILLSFCLGSKAAVRGGAFDGDGTIKVFRLYPNPASSYINFEFKSIDDSYTLQIYNFLGKKVYSQVVNSNKITVSVENLYRGLYVYQLRDASGNIEESGKFQIIR